MSYVTDLPTDGLPAGSTWKKMRRHRPAPSFALIEGGAEAEDEWIVPYAGLAKFMNVVAGGAELITGGVFGARWIPLRFHEYPTCIAVTARARFIRDLATAAEGDPGDNYWTHAFVRISYRTPKYPLSGSDALMTYSSHPAVYPVRIPAGSALVGAGSNPETLYSQVGGKSFTYRLHRLASYNPAAWANAVNLVNNATWQGYAAGTVLFPGIGEDRQANVDGSDLWELTLPFQYRAIPWQQDYDASGALGDVTVDGNSRYTPADFAATFGIS